MTFPLPLVTVTFTTDELAMMSAGLIQLRKFWVSRSINDKGALDTIQRITDLMNRIQGLVSPEQGQALLGELIKELRNPPNV